MACSRPCLIEQVRLVGYISGFSCAGTVPTCRVGATAGLILIHAAENDRYIDAVSLMALPIFSGTRKTRATGHVPHSSRA